MKPVDGKNRSDTGCAVLGASSRPVAGLAPRHKRSSAENDLLRKLPPRKTHETHLAYGDPAQGSGGQTTSALPVGAQARFIEASEAAAAHGAPINCLLTIRWTSLFSSGDLHWLRALPTPEQIAQLVERVRKWLIHRDLPAFYIWVREATCEEAEHWHMGLHLPPRLDEDFASYIGQLTGEPPAGDGSRKDRDAAEIARGEIGSGQIARNIRPERKGYFFVAYLGKAEPSEISFRGRIRPNKKSRCADRPSAATKAAAGMMPTRASSSEAPRAGGAFTSPSHCRPSVAVSPDKLLSKSTAGPNAARTLSRNAARRAPSWGDIREEMERGAQTTNTAAPLSISCQAVLRLNIRGRCPSFRPSPCVRTPPVRQKTGTPLRQLHTP